jgi:hypothetical protein
MTGLWAPWPISGMRYPIKRWEMFCDVTLCRPAVRRAMGIYRRLASSAWWIGQGEVGGASFWEGDEREPVSSRGCSAGAMSQR